jgi:tetratricopeptide (TPR) repeat protein
LEELRAKTEPQSGSERARPLNALGILLANRGDYGTARGLFEQSLGVERARGNKEDIAWTVYQLGHLASAQGEYEMARELFEEGLAVFQEMEDPAGTAASLAELGNPALKQGDLGAGRSLYEASLAISRELGNQVAVAIALNNLGKIAREQRDRRAACALHAESLTIRQELGDKGGFPWSLEAFARLSAPVDPERAARLWGAAEALRESLGLPLPPSEREEYDRAVSAVQGALGPETFTRGSAAGREMTLEEAISYAMETQDAVASAPGQRE